MIWCCPKCHGKLVKSASQLICNACHSKYEMIAGIPDLRVTGSSWIDFNKDRNKARILYKKSKNISLEETVFSVYAAREGWTSERINLRTQQVMMAVEKRRPDVISWLQPCMVNNGIFLDLGCGPGMLVAAAAKEGFNGVGIDVSMEWLVVAQKMISEMGGEPVLAAAMAENLPLASNSMQGIVSLDVIEHVGDVGSYLEQISRVLAPQGYAALTTPNRYSLTPEPHVFVWGVGMIPRCWQKSYVRWVSGKDYDYTTLLSSFELARLLKKHTSMNYKIRTGVISPHEIEHFRPFKALLARCYNHFQDIVPARWLFHAVGPFFVIICQKRGY
jgi:2-polyprenyl-3-methyl-5-hydroxy-6-metoxy-1,4-benzoquinol methylase